MIRKEMESKERKRETEEESMNRKKMESKERRRQEWRKRLLRGEDDQQVMNDCLNFLQVTSIVGATNEEGTQCRQ